MDAKDLSEIMELRSRALDGTYTRSDLMRWLTLQRRTFEARPKRRTRPVIDVDALLETIP
jgi:hypothetical protein